MTETQDCLFKFLVLLRKCLQSLQLFFRVFKDLLVSLEKKEKRLVGFLKSLKKRRQWKPKHKVIRTLLGRRSLQIMGGSGGGGGLNVACNC